MLGVYVPNKLVRITFRWYYIIIKYTTDGRNFCIISFIYVYSIFFFFLPTRTYLFLCAWHNIIILYKCSVVFVDDFARADRSSSSITARVGVRPRNTKPNRILLYYDDYCCKYINDICGHFSLILSHSRVHSVAHTSRLSTAIEDADKFDVAVTAESIGKHVIAVELECLPTIRVTYTGIITIIYEMRAVNAERW